MAGGHAKASPPVTAGLPRRPGDMRATIPLSPREKAAEPACTLLSSSAVRSGVRAAALCGPRCANAARNEQFLPWSDTHGVFRRYWASGLRIAMGRREMGEGAGLFSGLAWPRNEIDGQMENFYGIEKDS